MIATYTGRVERHETFQRRDGSSGTNLIVKPDGGDGRWTDQIACSPAETPAPGTKIAGKLLLRAKISQHGRPFIDSWLLEYVTLDGSPDGSSSEPVKEDVPF